MTFINKQVLSAISPSEFQNTVPFPFVATKNILTDEGFDELMKSMPDISLFEKSEGMTRAYGQKPHDRYELKYRADLPISPAWKTFIDELSSYEYRTHMAALFGTSKFAMRYQWQYAYTGSSVSPHCDSHNKVGSHLLYFNTSEDWDMAWGGRTLVLDDEGAFSCKSAPAITDFKKTPIAVDVLDNRSLIFMRTDHSWHAVEEIHPPEGTLRRLFTVIFDKRPSLWQRVRAVVR